MVEINAGSRITHSDLAPATREPLHEQIAAVLRERIARGDFPLGSTLPPAQELAATLGVNRNTVLRAYRQLDADEVVDLRRSRGAVVRSEDDISDVLALIDRLLDAASDAHLTVGALLGLVSRRAATR